MYILDIMFEIKNRKEFINAFQCFCEDLVKFELPWFEMLYDFSISFISLNLFINPDIFLVKMYLLAGYNSIEINLSFNRNIILLLYKFIENNIISLDEILYINSRLFINSENKFFFDFINDLENNFISYSMEDSADVCIL